MLIIVLFIENQYINIFCQEVDTIVDKPVVGIALSGGGAKGLAYIGILEVIDSIGIPIHYIGGTSIGSIIGGLTALGYSPEYIKNYALNTDWKSLLGNSIKKQYSPSFERKLRSNYTFTLSISDNWKIEPPGGVLNGQKINDLLTRLCSPYYYITDFSKFPIPYFCIAVDIQSGKPVEFNSGYLPDAILASMSIPLAIVPKEIDNKLYIDGGFVNNFPVMNLKNKGVENIIGLDVQRNVTNIDSINTVFEVMRQVMDINRRNSNVIGYKLSDILIRPDITGINIASFDSAKDIIERGRNAAYQYIPQLEKLSDSLKNLGYKPFKHLDIKPLDSVYIESIELEGLKYTDKNYIINNLQFKIPGYVKLDDIEKTLDILRASYLFKYVYYKLKECNGCSIIVFQFSEMSLKTFSIGINYFKYRYFSLLLNYTFKDWGKKWGLIPFLFSTNVGIGLYPSLKVDNIFYWNKSLKTGLSASIYSNPAFFYINDTIASKCTMINTNLMAFINKDFKNGSYIISTLEYEAFNNLFSMGNLSLNKHFPYLSSSIKFRYNSLDNIYFPKEGTFINAETKMVFSNFNKNFKPFLFSKINSILSTTVLEKNINVSFISNFYLGISYNKHLPLQYKFYLGGNDYLTNLNIVTFDGLKLMEKSCNNILSFIESIQIGIKDINYLTFSAGIANLSDNLESLFTLRAFQTFVSISYGILTPIFPAKISIGKSLNKKGFTFELSLGYYIK